jgi:hypothetical protein
MEKLQPTWGITANAIMHMIERRKMQLEQQWLVSEHGTQESGETLARIDELSALKWELRDVLNGYSQV